MRVVERGVGRCVISWMTKIDIAIAGCCAARVTALECGQAWWTCAGTSGRVSCTWPAKGGGWGI